MAFLWVVVEARAAPARQGRLSDRVQRLRLELELLDEFEELFELLLLEELDELLLLLLDDEFELLLFDEFEERLLLLLLELLDDRLLLLFSSPTARAALLSPRSQAPKKRCTGVSALRSLDELDELLELLLLDELEERLLLLFDEELDELLDALGCMRFDVSNGLETAVKTERSGRVWAWPWPLRAKPAAAAARTRVEVFMVDSR